MKYTFASKAEAMQMLRKSATLHIRGLLQCNLCAVQYLRVVFSIVIKLCEQ